MRLVLTAGSRRWVLRKSALAHLVDTFFGGSKAETVAALLDLEGRELTAAELDALGEAIEQARKEGR